MSADQPSTAGPAPSAVGSSQPDLTLLLSSPRIAAGLLSRPAWQSLEGAGRIWCADVTDPQPEAIFAAGLDVSEVPDRSPSELATSLVLEAQRSAVVWIGSPDGDPGLTDALAVELSRIAALAEPPSVEVLVGSHDVPGARLLDLVAVMDRLRSPGGCPWDARQTPTSLVPYLVEEAFEAVEAIETGDRAAMREELGDVLLQVVFHARVAQEHPTDPFDVDVVADGIVAKLVHRHPHVFGADVVGEGGDAAAQGAADHEPDVTPEALEASWDALKAAEKARASVLDGVPAALPALARAEKVLSRLERASATQPAFRRQDRFSDGESGLTGASEPTSADELGDALLRLVGRARAAGLDPEAVLRERVRQLEAAARAAEAGDP